MIKVAIIGASGYAGAELVSILLKHPEVLLTKLFVSEKSEDKYKKINSLYGSLYNKTDLILEPLPAAEKLKYDFKAIDAVFLATDHKVSHDIAPILYDAGCAVFDLSGAYRLKNLSAYEKYYGFKHENLELLNKAVYSLCEIASHDAIKNTRMLSIPGCYTTSAELPLIPLCREKLLDADFAPVINSVSGVSGAGRKAKLSNSFCEVSLNAYNIFKHRHLPEIEEYAGTKVIFNPHLGSFKRGILTTITAKLSAEVDASNVLSVFLKYYENKPLVRIKNELPKLQDVINQPYCDIGFTVSEDGYIVICSAIDNLQKGAAAQAVQTLNLHFDFNETTALI